MKNYRFYRFFKRRIRRIENCSTVLLIDTNGSSHYTSYLARGLSRHRDVILCGLSNDDYIATGAAKERRIIFYNIGQRLDYSSLLSIVILNQLLLFYKLFRLFIKKKFDIVHIIGHMPTFFFFFPLLKLKGKQIYVTMHEVNLRPSRKGIQGSLEVLFLRVITQPHILSRYSNGIIVHSSMLKSQLASKGVDRDKIYTIPHFDYRYLLDLTENVTESNSYAFPKDYILFFGRIGPYKGIDILINATKIARTRVGNNRLSLLIAGKGDRSYYESLVTKEDYEYIHILNEFIPNSKIPQIFKNAKLVVLPYMYSNVSKNGVWPGSGVLPLAYTFSKAVIVSNIGTVAENVEHGKTGFVFESGNSTQLANYIIQLVNDNKKCITMGKQAYEKMLREMSLEKCCEVINNAYIRNETSFPH